MSNSRTIETKVIWHLELTPGEDAILRSLLVEPLLERDEPRMVWSINAQLFVQKLISLYPKGGGDEKTTVDSKLSFDELCALDDLYYNDDGPDASVPMGPPADGADASGSRPTGPGSGSAVPEHPTWRPNIAEPKYAPKEPTSGKPPNAYDTQSIWAGVPDADASSTAALDRLAKLSDVCSGRCKDPLAKEFDIAAQRSAKSEWDKPRR